MKRISTKEAAELWQMPIEKVRMFCEKGRLPPGYHVIISGEKRHTFYIYKEGTNEGTVSGGDG